MVTSRQRAAIVGAMAALGLGVGLWQGGPLIAAVLAGLSGALGLVIVSAIDERARARRVEESRGGRK